MKIPKEHKIIRITSAGGPEVLQAASAAVPQPEANQMLIRVAAAGINRHDCNQRQTGAAHDGTHVPGLEVSGVIVQAGISVPVSMIGRRVMALVQGGGYAQYVIAEQELVLPLPENLSFLEGAAIPEALFTTWFNFFELMKLQSDEFALIHGGTSGVGHLALQAMSALGYKVIATSGSEEKIAAARRLGAFAAFSYRDPDLAQKVLAATSNQGIGALLDMAAGAHLETDVRMMAKGGRMAHLSGGGGKVLEVPLRDLMAKQLWITGSLLRPQPIERKALIAEMIRRDVLPLLGTRIRPIIARSFPLDDASQAHRVMEENSHIGKIVLNVAA